MNPLMRISPPSVDNNQIVLYRADDGQTQIDVHLQDETVWLTLDQIAALFDRDKSVVSRHIQNVFKTRELSQNSVVAIFATTAADGKIYQVNYFNLDMIISVGYRVNSKRGTQFCSWGSPASRIRCSDPLCATMAV